MCASAAAWTVCALLGVAPSTRAAPRFIDVSAAVGIDWTLPSRLPPNAAGIALFDYDGDGRLDVLFTDEAACRLMRNVPTASAPGFRLVDVSLATGLSRACPASAAAVIDDERTGYPSLLLAYSTGVVLLANVPSPGAPGGRAFVERSASAGLGGEVGAATLSVADYDGDGHPDVYVGRYVVQPRFPHHTCGRNVLYRNRGDGTFEDVAASVGADDAGCALAATFVDLDGDGLLDLFVVNDFGLTVRPNDVLRFDGARFNSVGAALGAADGLYGMGVALGDVNGDGRLDYYVTNIGRNVLRLGTAAGFVDATERAGVALATAPDGVGTKFRASWGAAMADFDLDGRQDLYVASGHLLAEAAIGTAHVQANAVFEGHGDGTFTLVADEGAEGRASRGVAIGDLDGDGVPDVVVSNLTSRDPTVLGSPTIYLSRPPQARRRLVVRLRGTVSEARAGGARVTAESTSGARQLRVIDTGGASHGSQHEAAAFFGFGESDAPARVSVQWPSGITSEHGVPVGVVQLALEEPAWLRVPETVSPGALATLEATPVNGQGAPLGGGHSVVFEVEGAMREGEATELGDGSYRQVVRAPTSAGVAHVRLRVDGVLLRARLPLAIVDGDRTTLRVLDAPPRTGLASRVLILPKDVDGDRLGPGHAVTLVVSGGTTGQVEDLGDGLYRAHFTAPVVAGPLFLRVTVDGVLQDAQARTDVVAALDAEASTLDISFALVGPGERAQLRALPVDGAGRTSPLLGEITFETNAGTLDDRPIPYAGFMTTQWLVAPTGAPRVITARARFRGQPVGREGYVLTTGVGPGAPPWLVDGARSRVHAFHAAMPADGRSATRVFLAARDLAGGLLPALPGTRFTTSAGSWRGPANTTLGNVPSRCLVAPVAPGFALACATVSGVEVAVCARVFFHEATPGAPAQDGCGDESFAVEVPEAWPGADGGLVLSPPWAPANDGGALDAGADTADAGADSADAGVIDGGMVDGGMVDAGRWVADGGSDGSADERDAGFEDDAGVALDAGIGADAGQARDAGYVWDAGYAADAGPRAEDAGIAAVDGSADGTGARVGGGGGCATGTGTAASGWAWLVALVGVWCALRARCACGRYGWTEQRSRRP